MAGLVPVISIMLAGQYPPKRDARDKRGHDAGKKKGEAKCLPQEEMNAVCRDQNFVVSRTVGPLKDRSTFEVVVTRVVPTSVAELSVLRALK